MKYSFIKEFLLNESIDISELSVTKLPYSLNDLDPVLSKEAMDYHFTKLYKTYVTNFNSGKGDVEFNKSGAFLHDMYFTQFKSPTNSNMPEGLSLDFINENFKSFDQFKLDFESVASNIQGSGWIYLSSNGQIKTIKNHGIKNDIVVLVDWWEHAWALDYQADKLKYLKNIWKIIDWSIINQRLIN